MILRRKSALFFKRGLRALLPTVLTIGVIVVVWNFFAANLVEPVNDGIRTFLVDTGPGRSLLRGIFDIDVEDPKYEIPATREAPDGIDWPRIDRDLEAEYPGIVGFFVALIIVFTAGFVIATFVGKAVLSRFESAMSRFPIVRIVYPYARQVVEFFMRERAVAFHSVVAIEYPRKGLWSIGFVTGPGLSALSEAAGTEMVNVFIPSCPTPVTGYVVFVPVKDVTPLPIPVDDALRIVITGGVLLPEDGRNPEAILDRFRTAQADVITSS